MVAKFERVAWITFVLLALVVGAMVGLNTVGIAQVNLRPTTRMANDLCGLCLFVLSTVELPSRFAVAQARFTVLRIEKEDSAQHLWGR